MIPKPPTTTFGQALCFPEHITYSSTKKSLNSSLPEHISERHDDGSLWKPTDRAPSVPGGAVGTRQGFWKLDFIRFDLRLSVWINCTRMLTWHCMTWWACSPLIANNMENNSITTTCQRYDGWHNCYIYVFVYTYIRVEVEEDVFPKT